MCSVCSPQWASGEANAMANYCKNSSIYPPPLLSCSLTRLCASFRLYVTCTATCASFTSTRIFQHICSEIILSLRVMSCKSDDIEVIPHIYTVYLRIEKNGRNCKSHHLVTLSNSPYWDLSLAPVTWRSFMYRSRFVCTFLTGSIILGPQVLILQCS